MTAADEHPALRQAQPKAPLGFSLVAGGPFHRLARRLHLVRGGPGDIFRQSGAVLAIAWAPLFVLAAAQILLTGIGPMLLVDLAVHIRFLVVIPLLFASEHALHVLTGRAIDRFHVAGLAGEDADRVPDIASDAEKLRDSAWPEIAMAVLALSVGLGMLLGGKTGFLESDSAQAIPASATRIWYGLIAFPLFGFLELRAIWRWLIWCHVLWRISRLRLALVVTHPDRTGGIGFLSDPSIGFAPFFTGMSALAAASWGNVMLAKGVPAQDFLAEGVLLLVIALIVTLGPLAMFSPHLLSARVQGRREYSALALDYSRAFHARWVQSRDPARLLGTGDIEPLANLADVYSGVKSVRLAPFGRQTALMIAILTLLPVGVLLLSDIPIADLTKGLVRLLVPVGI